MPIISTGISHLLAKQTMAQRSQHTLMIIGHSFVKRLMKFLAQSENHGLSFGPNLGLREDFGTVIFHGTGGLTLRGLREDIDTVRTVMPTAVIIQIGTNDLSMIGCDPITLGTEIVQFAQWLLRIRSVREVVICQIFPRVLDKSMRHGRLQRTPWAGTRDDFNEVRQLANDTIRNRTRDVEHVHYWPHRGMHKAWRTLFDKQGVHLNRTGQRLYARSIRGAAILARKWCANSTAGH